MDLGVSIGERIADEEEGRRREVENAASNLRVAMPGRIVDFNAKKQTATVQPLLREYVRGEWVDMPVLMDVPCIFPRAGGYCLTFPVKKGDECQIQFNDMCIDSWWQSGGIQNQLECRRHDLSDATCHLGLTSVPCAVEDYSTDSMRLRNEDNDVYFEIMDEEYDKVMNIYGIDDINLTTEKKLTVLVRDKEGNDSDFYLHEIDGEGNTSTHSIYNTEKKQEVLNVKVDTKSNSTVLTTTNFDTRITTINITLDGQNGTISMTTFDKDSGAVTGTFNLP